MYTNTGVYIRPLSEFVVLPDFSALSLKWYIVTFQWVRCDLIRSSVLWVGPNKGLDRGTIGKTSSTMTSA